MCEQRRTLLDLQLPMRAASRAVAAAALSGGASAAYGDTHYGAHPNVASRPAYAGILSCMLVAYLCTG